MKRTSTFHLITLLLTLSLAYLFRAEIMIAGAHVGAYFENAQSEELLGEYYTHRSMKDSKRASMHFQRALTLNKKELAFSPPEMRKWLYYIIGTHYECGKGASKDLISAKQWFQKAANEGLPKGMEMVDVIEQALLDIQKVQQSNNQAE